jgi:hypothetical protein
MVDFYTGRLYLETSIDHYGPVTFYKEYFPTRQSEIDAKAVATLTIDDRANVWIFPGFVGNELCALSANKPVDFAALPNMLGEIWIAAIQEKYRGLEHTSLYLSNFKVTPDLHEYCLRGLIGVYNQAQGIANMSSFRVSNHCRLLLPELEHLGLNLNNQNEITGNFNGFRLNDLSTSIPLV